MRFARIGLLTAAILTLAASCGASEAAASGYALNPAVTQATIGSTVCKTGWTATIRPPVSYTNALKKRQMAAEHLKGFPSAYEEDHIIPLELGGAPRNPLNLRPVPITRAHSDDKHETSLKNQVCKHSLTLKAAQAKMLVIKKGE